MHDVGRVRGATFSARASRIALLSIRWKKIIDITSKRVKPIRPEFSNIFSYVFDYWKENYRYFQLVYLRESFYGFGGY